MFGMEIYYLSLFVYIDTGTVRKQRREVPRPLTTKQHRAAPSSVFVFNNENNQAVTIVSCKPEARKEIVLLLSTEHHDDEVPQLQNSKQKPAIMLEYNSRKGGVDAADQLVGEYTCQRPTRR